MDLGNRVARSESRVDEKEQTSCLNKLKLHGGDGTGDVEDFGSLAAGREL